MYVTIFLIKNHYLLKDIFIEPQKCVVLKCMLQSLQMKDHVKSIGIYQSLSKNSLYEYKCLQNIRKLYKQAGKCDDQQQFKYIYFPL